MIVTVDMGVDTTCEHLRDRYTVESGANGRTVNIRRASIWTNLEVFIGFFVSCFPSLSPTFRFLRRKITGQSTTAKTSQGKPSNPIALSMQRSGHTQSAMHSVSMHGKGGDVEIPMYAVSHTKPGMNDSEDNITADDGKMYNNLEFKVHVEKEVYTTSKV